MIAYLLQFSPVALTIRSFLLECMLSILILFHLNIFSSSFFKSVNSLFRFSDVILTHISNACIGVHFLMQFSNSLMCNMKSKDPSNEPCGKPHFKILL